MIKINPLNINDICEEYTERVISHKYKFLPNNIYSRYFETHCVDILKCPARNLQNIISEFNEHFPDHNDEGWKSYQKYMKDIYKRFIAKNGIWLSQKLNVSVCPYCNRQYTSTVNGSKKIRPQFDHFYPKSKYPYLALSFYNLIPCCPTCNHAKGDDEIDLNPYVNGFSEECSFSVDRIDKCLMQDDNWGIIIENSEKYKKDINSFALSDLYNLHKDYVKELFFRALTYESSYVDDLKVAYKRMNLSDEEIERMIWGNYINTDDYGKRPLSKLTHDIIKQCRRK